MYASAYANFLRDIIFSATKRRRDFSDTIEPRWAEPGFYPAEPYDASRLRESLEAAVRRQLMCDVPYGVLISGGVDSSIVAAVAAKFGAGAWSSEGGRTVGAFALFCHRTGGRARFAAGPPAWPSTLGRSITKSSSPCRRASTRCRMSIYHLESFDITSMRATTPMYMLMRKVSAMGIKMILSGEGADEIFGGYLYFHKAPNGRALHEETVRKLQKLHLYDCARANKACAAWGVEARVPYLDREFLDVAMMLDPEIKLPRNGASPRPIEKWPLAQGVRGLYPRVEFCGGRRSSSPTASATTGSMR